jgi:PKD repeat protein
MKNCILCFVLTFACLLGLQAQQYSFSGHLTNTTTGSDAAFVNVKILTYDSLTSNLLRQYTVQADSLGNYSYTYIQTNGPALGYGDIEVTDCNNAIQTRHFTFTNTNTTLSNLDLGFCSPLHTCQAQFVGNSHNGYPLVNFDDHSSSNTGFVVNWDWQFGDGNIGNGQATAHQYALAGTYYACQTITTNLGCTSTFCDSVRAGLPSFNGCQVNLTATNISPGFYGFKALATGNGTPVSYRFEFDNLHSVVTNTDSTVFAFAQPGNYWIRSFVLFSNFCSTEHWINLNVPNGYCNAYFNAIPDTTGQYTQILQTYTFGNVVNYFWDFGDGSTSTVPYPTHTYAGPGTYNVCLTASDSNNICSSIYCDSIVVINKLGAAFTIHVVSGVSTAAPSPVESLTEWRIFPNPATERVQVQVLMERAGPLKCEIRDLSGRRIAFEDAGIQTAGTHLLDFDLEGFSPGLYFLRVQAGLGTSTKKLVLAL